MDRHLFAAFALFAFATTPVSLHAKTAAPVPATVQVTHVGPDTWRVDYRFSQPITAFKLDAVGDYRQQAWIMRTPGMRLRSDEEADSLSAGGRPFTKASVEIRRFDGLVPKAYAPFMRFSDGGTAMFLGHLQGQAVRGSEPRAMATQIRVSGLASEQVIAPPFNTLIPGGERGYAYFGPANALPTGAAKVLLDPKTPDWMRETVLDVSAKLSRYYEQAYGRPLKSPLLTMLAIVGGDAPGMSVKGGATLGQMAFRVEGSGIGRDHPLLRDHVSMLVAHEMAHIWQLNIVRGGIGEADPWIHEGGAEAMALEGLRHTGIWSEEKVARYHADKASKCEQLGNAVDSYDGIYACGLARFNKMGGRWCLCGAP